MKGANVFGGFSSSASLMLSLPSVERVFFLNSSSSCYYFFCCVIGPSIRGIAASLSYNLHFHKHHLLLRRKVRELKPWLLLLQQEKRARSHVYIYWAEHRRNYSNLLTHTLDYQPHAGLKILFLIYAVLINFVRIDTIISISKKLSIVFVRRPK